MLADFARVDPPMARHAEVKNQRIAAIGIDQPVFGPPAQADNPRTGQPLAEVDRQGVTKVGPPRLDPFDATAVEDMGEATDSCFDFGKFRHQGDMAEPPQPR